MTDKEALLENKTKESNPKDDTGSRKAGFSPVPVSVFIEIGLALTEGKLKYGANNWTEIGVRSSIYYDAALRHLFSWWCGEDIDPDSGIHHVSKAIASLTVLRDAMIRNKVTDDRPPSIDLPWKTYHRKVSDLIDQYSSIKPKHYYKK